MGAVTIMENDYESLFTTIMVPMYTSVEDIRLSLGAFIDTVPDNSIAVLIHRNSIRAQSLGSFNITNPPLYVIEYVSCKTAVDLLNAVFLGVGSLGAGRRTLGDMTITNETGDISQPVISLLEQLGNCVKENEILIKSGGVGVLPRHAVPHISAGDPYPGESWKRLASPDSVSDHLLKPGTVNRNPDNPPFPFRTVRTQSPRTRRNI